MFLMQLLCSIRKGRGLVASTQSVSLQVSIPSYQNITEEAVIEAEASRSKEGQVVEEVVPERPFLGYYEGTVRLFKEPVHVLSSKEKNEQGAEIPVVWPPKMVYGITSSASSSEERYKHIVADKLATDEEKDVEVSLAEFTDTIQGQSVVRVSPVTGSDKTKGKVQNPSDTKDFTTPTAESTREGNLNLTPSYEHQKERQQNQYQVGKDILNETIDEETKVILLEVQKAMEEKFRAEKEAFQLKL